MYVCKWSGWLTYSCKMVSSPSRERRAPSASRNRIGSCSGVKFSVPATGTRGESQVLSLASCAGPGFFMSTFWVFGNFHSATILDQDFGRDGVVGMFLGESSGERVGVAAAVSGDDSSGGV